MTMTTERFNEIVFDVLCQNIQSFSRFADRGDRTVHRWSTGAMIVPDSFGEWMEKMAALVQANPPPAKPPIRVYDEPVAED
jgi:hypothetical protein